MSARRTRTLLAAALLAVAALMLWRMIDRHGAELVAEWDSRRGEPTLPAGAAARGALPRTPAPVELGVSTVAVRTEEVASGFRHPLFVTHAGDNSGRLFVVEQTGAIQVVAGGKRQGTAFLDLSSELDTAGGERGLLGLAFAPDFARSGRFFVAHTAPGPVVRLARYRADPAAAAADPSSKQVLLEMADPAGNHNGGMLAFGPDGYLYHGTGDGGSGGDPWDNARDRDSLLGKMLRFDANGETLAAAPGNPFASGTGRSEIWALGLRNPWRFSFDRETGELWIGDVGQNAWEEIDVENPKEGGGRHYGWKTMEGFHCYSPRQACDPSGLTLPVHAYGRGDGCSITGGYVYRGKAIPALTGAYLFGDFCTGRIWTLRRGGSEGAEGEEGAANMPGAGAARVELLLDTPFAISSFGEDEAGEIYVCDHERGAVHRLSPPLRPVGS